MRKIIVGLALLFSLAACGGNMLREGKVLNKAERFFADKPGGPAKHAEYYIVLENCTASSVCQKQAIAVDAATYKRAEIGKQLRF